MPTSMSSTVGKKISTTCTLCGIGCGLIAERKGDGSLQVSGDPLHPVNKGQFCSLAENLQYTIIDYSERLNHPYMKWNRQMDLRQISWDVALERLSKLTSTFSKNFGADSMAMLTSGNLLLEEQYLAHKLSIEVIGTKNIDTSNRSYSTAPQIAVPQSLGSAQLSGTVDLIDSADCFFISGSDIAVTNPVLFHRIVDRKKYNPNIKIIVVDPVYTETARIADLHIQIAPGTDTILYNAIARAIIESGHIDSERLSSKTNNFNAYKGEVYTTQLQLASEISGVTVRDIRLCAEIIGKTEFFLPIWKNGINQTIEGVNKNLALLNLSLLRINEKRKGTDILPLQSMANGNGAFLVRELFENNEAITKKNHLIRIIEGILEGKIKMLWIVGQDPFEYIPNTAKLEQALSKLKFVVVQGASQNWRCNKYADLILPSADRFERGGSICNSEFRIENINKILPAPGEALPNIDIFNKFISAFDSELKIQNRKKLFEEFQKRSATKGVNIPSFTFKNSSQPESFVRFENNDNSNANTKSECADKFEIPAKEHQFIPVGGIGAYEPFSNEFPLTLSLRSFEHSEELPVAELPDGMKLFINPLDASERGINHGDIVELFSAQAMIKAVACVSDSVLESCLSIKSQFDTISEINSSNALRLLKFETDPQSAQPDINFTRVQVRKFNKKAESIYIIGNGDTAVHFIKAYRQRNLVDDIVFISRSKTPFFSKEQFAEVLSKRSVPDNETGIAEFIEENIVQVVHADIKSITPENQSIIDSTGRTYYYDKLILATGKRQKSKINIPKDIKSVFNIWETANFSTLCETAKPNKHAVVVGGGPTGLKTAAALHELGLHTTMTTPSSRLLKQQADRTASEILHGELSDRGIECIFNDNVQTISAGTSGDKPVKLHLKSGRSIKTDIAIFATETAPEIELAQRAGIKCNRGIIVDSTLSTSLKNIYAIGAATEFNDDIAYSPAVTKEQAQRLAYFLCGNEFSIHKKNIPVDIIDIDGFAFATIGQVSVPEDNAHFEETIVLDKRLKYYKKCIIENGKLAGAILQGDITEVNQLLTQIQTNALLGDNRRQLLFNHNA